MKKIKIPYLNLLPVLVIAFIVFKLIDTMNISVNNLFKVISDTLSSFVFGFIVAYLLNPAMNYFEKLISSQKDNEKVCRIKRAGVITFLFLMLIGLLTVFVVSVIPAVQAGIQEIIENMPIYTHNLENWITSLTGKQNEDLYIMLEGWVQEGSKIIYNWLKGLNFTSVSVALTAGVSGVTMAIVRIGFGFVISIYYLYGKEKLINGIKKLLFVMFGKEKAQKCLEISRSSNVIFQRYITGRILQSFILFVLGMLVLIPFGFPFAPLIAFVFGFSNLIPYIGPVLGTVACVVLVLFYSPVKALWLLIYTLGVQFLDNWIIGPKVMSEQVGISPLLVIAGVTIGGIFGGLFGMILGVPAIAIIKLVFYDPYIERKLKENEIEI